MTLQPFDFFSISSNFISAFLPVGQPVALENLKHLPNFQTCPNFQSFVDKGIKANDTPCSFNKLDTIFSRQRKSGLQFVMNMIAQDTICDSKDHWVGLTQPP